MESFERILLENKAWAMEKLKFDPDFFTKLSGGQIPKFLWIGCSDSRVPAEVIVNAEPGEMFIHRNVANLVVATDFNCMSVLQFAINVLKVKDIIVCGHYNCGGIKAALNSQNPDLTLVNKWLMHIKNIYRFHKEEIEALPNEEEKMNRLVELNITEQIRNLSHTAIIQKAWKDHQSPVLHGCVYSLNDGILREIVTMDSYSPIEKIYKHTF